MAEQQITVTHVVTPWYLDKSYWLVILGIVAPIIAAKLGVRLNAEQIAADGVGVATFIVAHKWKSGTALKALIEDQAGRAQSEIRARYLLADPPAPATDADATAKVVRLPPPLPPPGGAA